MLFLKENYRLLCVDNELCEAQKEQIT